MPTGGQGGQPAQDVEPGTWTFHLIMALGQGGGCPSDERARLNDSDEAEFDPA